MMISEARSGVLSGAQKVASSQLSRCLAVVGSLHSASDTAPHFSVHPRLPPLKQTGATTILHVENTVTRDGVYFLMVSSKRLELFVFFLY